MRDAGLARMTLAAVLRRSMNELSALRDAGTRLNDGQLPAARVRATAVQPLLTANLSLRWRGETHNVNQDTQDDRHNDP